MSEHDDPDAADWELASGYVDDAIDATERARVEASPALMAMAAQLRAVRDGLARRPFAPPGARDAAVAAALAAFDEQHHDDRPVAAAAATAALGHLAGDVGEVGDVEGDVEGEGPDAMAAASGGLDGRATGALATVHDLTAARRRRYRWATGAVAAAVIAILVVIAIRPGADHRPSSADRPPATTQRPAPPTDNGGGKAESVPVAAPSAASTGPAGAPAVAAPGTAALPASPATVAAATGAVPSTIAAPAVGAAAAPATTAAGAATTLAGSTTVPFGGPGSILPGAAGGAAPSPSTTSVPEIDSPGQLLALARPDTTAASANPAGTVATDQAATTTASPAACLPEHVVVLATITYQGRPAIAVVDDARHVREALDATTCALLAQVTDTP
jgi:hypothetical protein